MTWLRQWGPALAAMIAIFVASSLPTVPRLPNDPNNYAPHFAAYAVLAMCALRGFANAVWSGVTVAAAWRAWLLSAAYGATDEIHQRFVPGRYPAVDDWVADAAGALAGVIVVLALHRVRQRRVARDV